MTKRYWHGKHHGDLPAPPGIVLESPRKDGNQFLFEVTGLTVGKRTSCKLHQSIVLDFDQHQHRRQRHDDFYERDDFASPIFRLLELPELTRANGDWLTPNRHRRIRAELCRRFFLSFQETLQMTHAGRVTQLAQCLGFNLADAFARDVVHLANFFERAFVAVGEAETHFENLAFASVSVVNTSPEFFLQQTVTGHIGRIFRRLVFDEIADAHVASSPTGACSEMGCCAILSSELMRETGMCISSASSRRGFAAEFLRELLLRAPELVHDFIM